MRDFFMWVSAAIAAMVVISAMGGAAYHVKPMDAADEARFQAMDQRQEAFFDNLYQPRSDAAVWIGQANKITSPDADADAASALAIVIICGISLAAIPFALMGTKRRLPGDD